MKAYANQDRGRCWATSQCNLMVQSPLYRLRSSHVLTVAAFSAVYYAALLLQNRVTHCTTSVCPSVCPSLPLTGEQTFKRKNEAARNADVRT